MQLYLEMALLNVLIYMKVGPKNHFEVPIIDQHWLGESHLDCKLKNDQTDVTMSAVENEGGNDDSAAPKVTSCRRAKREKTHTWDSMASPQRVTSDAALRRQA